MLGFPDYGRRIPVTHAHSLTSLNPEDHLQEIRVALHGLTVVAVENLSGLRSGIETPRDFVIESAQNLCDCASVVSTKCLDSGGGRSASILPANAAKMAALHRPANQWTSH